MSAHSRFRCLVVFALLAPMLAVGSCRRVSPDMPQGVFTISGRLTSDFGCTVLSDGSKIYELGPWHESVPTMGSFVTLRVKPLTGVASVCMVGEIVEVLQVLRVVTDFRTTPVTGSETWTPSQGPIVLGKVEVVPGARLTIQPGTVVHIVPEGELRVRGTLTAVGTAADSVRIVGPFVLDSAMVDTRVAFASLSGLTVTGAADYLEHLGVQGRIYVRDGRGTIGNSAIVGSVLAENARVTVASTELGSASAIYGNLEITRSTLTRLELSWSHATVADSRFMGDRTYILFHGPSGGAFDRNTFQAMQTDIEVRHTSDPAFHHNNFVSPSTNVVCESYQLSTCVRMEDNWWGTSDESQISAHFGAASSVCYAPWLTGPIAGLQP
jgi:hypothetical protein